MNWTACLYASPLNWLSGALVALDLALAVYYAVKLSFSKDSEQLTGMEHGINIMLPTSYGMLFFAFLDPLVSAIQASFSIAHTRTGLYSTDCSKCLYQFSSMVRSAYSS